MPVEIRELHIRVNVNERQSPAQSSANTSAPNQERAASEAALVKECVEQTIQIIQEKQER